tara:strand:- start:56 stop:679 length:624 start_codon:yes stop_codon:yes gene_type:complete
MKILIACETSGTVRNAFLDRGHDAWSCDVLPSDDLTNRHIRDDVLEVLKMESWDMLMVAHPPCTRLCNSGVRWLHKAPPGKTLSEMWEQLDQGAELFSKLWNADVPRVAIENPVMHKHAKARIKNFQPFAQSVQPYEFADSIDAEDNVSKRTCLWLRNLPPLIKTGTLTRETARQDIYNASPGKDRWKVRSKFHKGIAQAMADQWGK